MASTFDFKKEYKNIYLPGTTPAMIDIPEMNYITVTGKGDPNQEDGEYQQAIGLLYAICYAIKMSKMGQNIPDGYFDYVMPPLEGFWWLADYKPGFDYDSKEKFYWKAMIRQPDFVNEAVFHDACLNVQKKKGLNPQKACLETITEGLCVQCMHIGSYDDEAVTLAKIEQFIQKEKLQNNISQTRHHHEIYLSDPRRTAPEKRKTILRVPVA